MRQKHQTFPKKPDQIDLADCSAGRTNWRSTASMSQPSDHDMTAVLEAIDHYSDGDVEQPQEIMVELQEGFSNKHKRLNKKVYEKELDKFQTELVKVL